MFKSNLGVIPCTPIELNEIGQPKDAIIVDQFYSQDFNRGENGFARSDIEAFIHAESDELKQVIAQRLYEVKSQYPDQNLSNEDMIKMCVPRNVQSLHDLRDWYSRIHGDSLEKSVNEWIKSKTVQDPRDSVIDFKPSDVPVTKNEEV